MSTSDSGVSTSGEAGPATFGEESDDDDPRGFIDQLDLGGGSCAPASPPDTLFLSCCDVWAQNCYDGAKCTPWSNDGSGAWNGTNCGPLDPDPDPVGAPCRAEASPASGVDSCELGAMCWNVDPETLEGRCVAHCQGTAQDPVCEQPGHACAIFNHALILCLPTCDPLGDDCDEGFACHPNGLEFVCIPGKDRGKLGDGCENENGCPVGEACVSYPMSETCPETCCVPYCDLGDPFADQDCAALGDEYACVAWFERGSAPLGYEHVGVCGVG